ncbi:MAG TPA: SUMF1/EgtB/PvdO family nonheme iron enzyme [Steroidobacteraceae bacterium]|nr:SUMF1/EgtB/PvdO family nonheme iron enzyme [Steroidobacteraceae bacterium]
MQSTARLAHPESSGIDRDAVVRQYRRNRARTRALFDLLDEDAYYSRPIALRHPLVFYEGHLPAFSFNTLVRRALGEPGIDARLESLFARGIDPHESQAKRLHDRGSWPDREVVRRFADEADRRVIAVLESADLERPGDPMLARAEAVFAILEHEAMHQETLRYLCHRLPPHRKRRPAGHAPATLGAAPAQEWVRIPPGRAALGVAAGDAPFSWDNERPAFVVDVRAFDIERHDTTNAAYLEFVEAGGYHEPRWWRPDDWAWVQRERVEHPAFWSQAGDEWQWRGMFDMLPLPRSWPVYVSFAEASAYAHWRGARLPTEAEFHRAAYGSDGPERREHPWGDGPPDATRGVFDFTSWDPEPAGAHPAGRSAFGVEDLVGNGWEWTSSVFAPFPGFRPLPSYPEYSADFFDGEHFVLKGASPATARELLRPSFRNWFRARYPHVYATFRCAREAVPA